MGNDAPEKSQGWLDSARLGRIAEQAIASALGTFMGGIALALGAMALGLITRVQPAVWILLALLALIGVVLGLTLVRSRRPLDPAEAAARLAYLDLYADVYRLREERREEQRRKAEGPHEP